MLRVARCNDVTTCGVVARRQEFAQVAEDWSKRQDGVSLGFETTSSLLFAAFCACRARARTALSTLTQEILFRAASLLRTHPLHLICASIFSHSARKDSDEFQIEEVIPAALRSQ